MKDQIIQFQAQMVRATPLADNGMSIGFHTQELLPEQKLIVINKFNKFGWLLFKEEENPFEAKDVPNEKIISDEKKSPAQRLRAVIFLMSRQQKIPKEKFEEYYRKKIETFIDYCKEKLV